MSDDDKTLFELLDIATYLRNQPPSIMSIEKIRWCVNDMWERNRSRGLLEGVDEHEWKERVFKSQMKANDENIAKMVRQRHVGEKQKTWAIRRC